MFAEITCLDFIIKKEHSFLRNIFDPETLSITENLKTVETYFDSFQKVLRIAGLLDNVYSSESDTEDIRYDCIDKFVMENEIESFQDLFLEVAETKVQNVSVLKKAKMNQIKIINFVYKKIMKFPTNELKPQIVVSKNFFYGVLNLLFSDVVIHHSHISRQIISYAHDFCNRKVKQSQYLSSHITCSNLIFSLLLKA